MEIAKHRLFDKEELNARDIKLYPGVKRTATPDQMAEQVNKAIAQIVAGDFDVVEEPKG